MGAFAEWGWRPRGWDGGIIGPLELGFLLGEEDRVNKARSKEMTRRNVPHSVQWGGHRESPDRRSLDGSATCVGSQGSRVPSLSHEKRKRRQRTPFSED